MKQSDANQDAAVTPQSATVVCANCGTVVSDKFCPHCGQNKDRQRLNLRTFLTRSLSDLFKVNSGFFFTAFRLLLCPWIVIRDYVRGHRVKYTSPVSMLVILIFYFAILDSLLSIDVSSVIIEAKITFTPEAGDSVLNTTLCSILFKGLNALVSSQIFIYMAIAIPMAAATYIVYFKFGSRRYNAAEFLVAAIYMLCSTICCNFITCWIKYIDDNTSNILFSVATTVIFVISLFKAFKVPNIFVRILLIVACVIVCIGLMASYIALIYALLNVL